MPTLRTNFSVKTISGCTKFYLKDTTPVYDSVSAPYGYDSGGTTNNPNNITGISVDITNMATPTVTRTVVVPTTSPTFTPGTIPGVVKYTISSYETALNSSINISSSNSTGTAGYVTYTTQSVHPYTVGQIVTVSGVGGSTTHNVTGVVTAVPASTVFTLSIPTIAAGTTGTGGTSLGYTSTPFTVTDGVYKFVYNVVLSGTTYSSTCYIVVDCTISDTMTSMLKELNCCNNCSDSNNTKLNLLYQAYLLREKACYLATCQDFTGAQDVLDCISAMIGTTSCDSCS